MLQPAKKTNIAKNAAIVFMVLAVGMFCFMLGAWYNMIRSRQDTTIQSAVYEELEAELEEAKEPLPLADSVADRRNVRLTRVAPTQNRVSPKRENIKAAMSHAWKGYERSCFGEDELKPIDGTCHRWFNLGVTIIDSLDTLHMMGLEDEFSKGREWVANHFSENLKKVGDLPFFEVVIRIVGGLLGAYDLSKDKMFLEKAKEMVDAMLPVYDTPTGLPMAHISPNSGGEKVISRGPTYLADMGSHQLEYSYLSEKIGDAQYRNKALNVYHYLDKKHKSLSQWPGLLPYVISTTDGSFGHSTLSVGAMADSYYEYQLKLWILTGKKNFQYINRYRLAMKDMIKLLYSKTEHYSYIGPYEGGKLTARMEHLTCFMPGLLALGIMHEAVKGAEAEQHRKIAEEVTATCVQMYFKSKTGLSGECAFFGDDSNLNYQPSYYILRPETVESLFLMWRLTHHPRYREWGWKIFENIEAFTKVDNGYSGLNDVNSPSSYNNKMESFFLAETLKYLYLLFSEDSLMPLVGKNAVVFNTEAHPLHVFS